MKILLVTTLINLDYLAGIFTKKKISNIYIEENIIKIMLIMMIIHKISNELKIGEKKENQFFSM